MTVAMSSLLMEARLTQLLLTLTAVFTIVLVARYLLLAARTPRSEVWKSHPCVGLKRQSFPWLRANFRSITRSQATVAEGYAKYSKSNVPFVVPCVSQGPVLILPPSQLRDVFNRPEDEVDALGPQIESLQASYTIGDPDIYMSHIHVNVVRRQLTRNLGLTTDRLAEEIALAFEQVWGTSTEWTTVNLLDSVCKVVARAANRVLLGLPLCMDLLRLSGDSADEGDSGRNDEFLDCTLKYSMSIFGGGSMINMSPKSLRPLVGSLVALYGRRHLANAKRFCQPVVEERLRNMRRKMADPNFAWEPPAEGLQWIVEECYKTQDPKDLEPERIARRMLMLNTISVHSTSLTTTNTILDLYSSASEEGFVDGLREESNRVLAEAGGVWTRAAVSKLIRVDSTIRESMRLSTSNFIAMPRRVSAPEGITIDGNIHLPQGTPVAIPTHEMHLDESFYPDGSRFDAFRFSRPREASEATKTESFKTGPGSPVEGDPDIDSRPSPTEEEEDEEAALPQTHSSSNALVTTSDSFLSFGYGKHSCPGRFFAAHEMKLMLAHLVQHYDVEPLPERPAQQPMMEGEVPPMSATIRIRRRKGM